MPRADTVTTASAPLHIPGWPVVLPGLLMLTLDSVVFMHLDDRMTDETYATYLRELEASLMNRRLDARVAVIYDLPTFSSLRAMGARAAGEILKRHRQTLVETTACFAVVTPSPIARIAVQTVLTVSQLSFPQRAVDSIAGALAFAASVLPALQPDVVEQRIAEAFGAHRLRMRG
jgi:hypothetical protein